LFVGADRQQIVEDLRETFDEVVSGAGSRMVVLSAPSGEGKTRVVQEFYRALAADQPMPHYWPPSLTDDKDDWKSDRKRLAVPRFTPGPDATIPWIYWSVSCQRRQDGSYAQALFDDITQFNAHAEPLFNRISASAATGRSVDGANALIGLLGGLGFLVIPPVGVALAGVGVARAIVHNRDIVDRFNRWRELRDQKKQGNWSLDGRSHGRKESVDDLVRNIADVSLDIPVVIAVDDIHWGDETLIACLDGILRSSRARVLVIATSWPEEIEAPENESVVRPFSEWCSRVQVQPLSRHLNIREVEPMAEIDLQVLIQATYESVTIESDPDIATAVVAALSERFATPMGVRAFFDLSMVKKQIHHGGLSLDDLTRLPTSLSQVIVAYWEELPEELQSVLAIAAISGERFATKPVVDAAALLDLREPERQIDRGRQPYRVIRRLEELLDVFTDLLLFQIASSRAEGEFSRHEMKVIYDSLVRYADALESTTSSTTLRSTAWSAVVALAQRDGDELFERSIAAPSAWKLAQFAASTFDFQSAIRYGGIALDWAAEGARDSTRLSIADDVASWLGESGRLSEALTACQTLLHERLEVLGPDHPDTLRTRKNIIRWLTDGGRDAEVLRAYNELLQDDVRALGPDHRETFITRNNMCLWLNENGQVNRAVDALLELIEDESRVLGLDDPFSLVTQNVLVYSLGAAGQLNRAIAEGELLLQRDLRVLGPDHRDTLMTRANLAHWLGESGRVADGLAALQTLQEDQLRVLGADHLDTLATRDEIAQRLGQSSRYAEALAACEILLKDELRVLGPIHPLTLGTRRILADQLAECGQIEDAITALIVLVREESQALIPDHSVTLKTRSSLAHWLGVSGRLSEAIDAFQLLLQDELHVFEADHPEVLKTRSNLAHWLAMNDQGTEAVIAIRAVLQDQLRILGPDHPDTLQTSRELVRIGADQVEDHEA
jgi:AAA ATPase domain/Tetratricopeptide repeat